MDDIKYNCKEPEKRHEKRAKLEAELNHSFVSSIKCDAIENWQSRSLVVSVVTSK